MDSGVRKMLVSKSNIRKKKKNTDVTYFFVIEPLQMNAAEGLPFEDTRSLGSRFYYVLLRKVR